MFFDVNSKTNHLRVKSTCGIDSATSKTPILMPYMGILGKNLDFLNFPTLAILKKGRGHFQGVGTTSNMGQYPRVFS